MNNLSSLQVWNGQKKLQFFVILPKFNLFYQGLIKRNKKDLGQSIQPSQIAEVLNRNEKCNLIFEDDEQNRNIDLKPFQQKFQENDLLSTFKIIYYEISAKTGENVQEAIYLMSKKVYEEKYFKKKKEKKIKNIRKGTWINKNIN